MCIFYSLLQLYCTFRIESFPVQSITEYNLLFSVPLPPDDVQISEVTTTSFRVSWSPSFGR